MTGRDDSPGPANGEGESAASSDELDSNESSGDTETADGEWGDEAALDSLLSFVEDELSFATSRYNPNYLDRRVTSRMRRTHSESYAEYFEKLRDDDVEQASLLDALSINVTGFFRNPDVWDGVRSILQEVSAERDAVRVWSAACADGREAYSVRMLALDDPTIDEDAVEIIGTDISEDALETARDGRYRRSLTVDIESELEFLSSYEEYVGQDEDSFWVNDEVKSAVTFERHDLINDEPKADFDLVICRNLFIYIDDGYKREVLDTLAASLRPDGYLVIGKAETIPPTLDTPFETLHGRRRIYHYRPQLDEEGVEVH